MPVVSVGNIEVGGTGKTPVTIYLARYLSRQLNKKVAVLSRGYGRRPGPARVLVSCGQGPLVSADVSGDEPWLIAKKTDAVVVVGQNRVESARFVEREFGVEVILLDDGFQHFRLQRTLDLVLISTDLSSAEEQLIPRGRLREPKSALRRAHQIACVAYEKNRNLNGGILGPKVGFLSQPSRLRRLVSGKEEGLLLQRKKVGLVSGIAKPQLFRKTVEELGASVVAMLSIGDHRSFLPGQLLSFEAMAVARGADFILFTEKDEGRLLLEPPHDRPKTAVVLEMSTSVWTGESLLGEALEGLFP